MTGARVPLALLAITALLVAGWGGLGRLGLLPASPGGTGTYHGALMVSGFVGTLIGLERSIVVQRPWAALAPILSATSGVALLVGVPAPATALIVVAAAAAFVVVTAVGAPTSPGIAVGVMTAGALSWLVAAIVWWQGAPAFRMMPWLLAFLVLTITAERMELARALRPSGMATSVLVIAATTFAAGVALTVIDLAIGMRIAGAGALVLALWLALRDRPPAAARARELPRFIALAISVSYAWLAVGAFYMVTFDGAPSGWRYDAMVHALFVGFVFTMIFGHGPIVIPSVLGGSIRYRRFVYVPLALLALSLVIRIGGDALERSDLRDGGAVGIAVAGLAFVAAMASSLRGRRAVGRSPR